MLLTKEKDHFTISIMAGFLGLIKRAANESVFRRVSRSVEFPWGWW